MKQIVALPSFERSFKKLDSHAKTKVVEALEQFNEFLISGSIPTGFGFKKINHDKYEFRVDIRLRVVMKSEGAVFYLVLVGNHDEVRRYLRNFR